jgi:hypothetical protein
MGRVENWPSILAAELEKARWITFQWGIDDCVLWSLSVVKAITGVDYHTCHLGKYSSKLESVRYLKRLGKDVEELFSEAFALIDIKHATRGDLIYNTELKAMGICMGQVSYFLNDKQGLNYRPTLKQHKAWRVG